jgi:hypothetical protein
VLLAGYCAFEALSDVLKSDTEKAIESILGSLEKKTIYRDKTAVQYLGLDGQLKALRDGLAGWDCLELLPNSNGSPTRGDLIQRMRNLGFNDKDASAMVEDLNAFEPPMMLMTP